jgi:hypothetical protein
MTDASAMHAVPSNDAQNRNQDGSSDHGVRSLVLYDTADYRLLRTGYLLQQSKTSKETTVRFYSIQPQLRDKPLSGLEYVALDKVLQFDARKEAAGKRQSLVKDVLSGGAALQPLLRTYADDSPDRIPMQLPLEAVEALMVQQARQPLDGLSEEPGLRSDMTMAEACRMIFREQLTKMLLNEAGVRTSSDIEYVHKMRVATRRARVAERLYRGFFRKKRMRRFAHNLRKTGRLLGAVRDLDVALERLHKAGKGGGTLTNHEKQLKSDWSRARVNPPMRNCWRGWIATNMAHLSPSSCASARRRSWPPSAFATRRRLRRFPIT